MVRDSITAEKLAQPILKDGSLDGPDLTIPDSFFSAWTGQVRQRFVKEIEALRRDMEERAFFATDHGATYTDPPKNTPEVG
jgi:hypothetical protein